MPSSADAKTVADRLKALRLEAKLTQVQLALKANVGQPAISSIETGGTKWLRDSTLLRLAAALDVDPLWLRTGQGAKNPDHSPPDFYFTDVISALTVENRRRLLTLARALLADQVQTDEPPPDPRRSDGPDGFPPPYGRDRSTRRPPKKPK